MISVKMCGQANCGHALTFHPDVVKFREEAPKGLPGAEQDLINRVIV